jgi:hypothetical protein
MIRVCAWCRELLGENCICGAKAVFARVQDTRVLVRCTNEKCGVGEFPVGENGATHGICEDCRAKHFPTTVPTPKKPCRGGAA